MSDYRTLIRVRYIPCTNLRGSRWSVRGNAHKPKLYSYAECEDNGEDGLVYVAKRYFAETTGAYWKEGTGFRGPMHAHIMGYACMPCPNGTADTFVMIEYDVHFPTE